MVGQENGTSIPPAEAPTILAQDDEDASYRDPIFVTEFADILLIIAKRGEERLASQLVDLLADGSFQMNNFKWYIKGLVDSKHVITRNKRKLMKDFAVHRVLVGRDNAKKDCCSPLYPKGVTDIFQKQVEFCGEDIIIFRLEGKRFFKNCIGKYNYNIHQTCFEEVKEVIRYSDSGNI